MPVSNPTETIDSRILRLIGLEDVFDLDYETYLLLLKEAMVKGRMTKKTIPTEEMMLLTDEYKRVKGKKDQGRFTVKKKKITSTSFSVGKTKGAISGSAPKAMLPPADKIAKSPVSNGLEENISAITASVSSIADILSGRKKLADDAAAYERRKAEQDKRELSESKLEKRFDGLKKAAEKVLAPVKSILDKITQFLVNVLLGRVVYKLIEWWGDPKNASKVKAIGRFLGDHWPKLLSLYLVFGTSFGKFARGLISLVIKSTIRLGAAVAALAVKAGVGKAGGKLSKVAGFLGGRKGKLLSAGLEAAVTVGGTMALSKTLEGDGGQKSQAYRGGGYVRPRFPTFAGGGLNFKGMMSGASMGAMFGPLGMLLGGAFGSGKPQQMISGFVSGESGVDKVPAMLSDGEFVMSRGAVAKDGVDTLEAMNAAGGGQIGTSPDIKEKPPEKTFRPGVDLKSFGSNVPFSKNPSDAIRRFIEYKFGVNLNNQSSWGSKGSGGIPSLSPSAGSTSTGSLLNNPIGALSRIAGNMGIKSGGGPKMPGLPGGFKLPSLPGGFKLPSLPSGKGKSGDKNFFQEIQEKLTGPGAATYRDAGSIYARQMLGGFGGPVSERDLSKESQQELQKAIQRAKKRTGSEIAKAQAKIKELEASGASKTPDGKKALATQKSFLSKLKAGGIRVQYTDYADEKGKMSESAKNAKNILGQFWATERSKKEGGGYRVEDKYDFDMFKKKDTKTGKMREMNAGELIKEGVLGKGKTVQQRLQAAYLLNPFRGKGDVDMVLGGKRTAAENFGLSASKTLLGGLLGISGNPKQRAQVAKSKPIGKPIKPPVKPSVKVVRTKADTIGSGSGGGKKSKTKTPKFGATCPASGNTKAKTLGVRK